MKDRAQGGRGISPAPEREHLGSEERRRREGQRSAAAALHVILEPAPKALLSDPVASASPLPNGNRGRRAKVSIGDVRQVDSRASAQLVLIPVPRVDLDERKFPRRGVALPFDFGDAAKVQ